MADSGSLQSLLSTKAALDLGLISQTDFDAVKGAFLRAQQIKAAQDVGLIRPEDYEDTKREYLDSLLAAGGAPSVSAPSAAQAPPPAEPPAAAAPPSPRPAPVAWSVPMASAPAPVPAAPQRAAAAAPPRQQQPPAVAPPAPTPAAPAPTPLPRVASNPSVPSNIPKMGGIKAVGNGVSLFSVWDNCGAPHRGGTHAAGVECRLASVGAPPAAPSDPSALPSVPHLHLRLICLAFADLHERHLGD